MSTLHQEQQSHHNLVTDRQPAVYAVYACAKLSLCTSSVHGVVVVVLAPFLLSCTATAAQVVYGMLSFARSRH